jgi:5-methylcytosine-specific restriction endonuclease McrA
MEWMQNESLSALGDRDLLENLRRLVARSNAVTAELVGHLAEVDRRRLYLRAACSSLHSYCTSRLRLSDAAAFKRIQAARLAQRFPVVLELLQRGALHLSAIVTLHPHLTEDNHCELLALAEGKSQRDLERLLAARNPRPDVADCVRRLPPSPAPASSPSATTSADNATMADPTPPPPPCPARGASPPVPARGQTQPLAADRYCVKFTASDTLIAKLDQARALLGHQLPSGDLAAIVERALDALIAERMKMKFAVTPRRRLVPRVSKKAVTADQRHVPAEVRRVVSDRDEYRCTYVDEGGNRCAERRRLEFDHVLQKARGGRETVDNLRLRCRPHNQGRAVHELGAEHVERAIATRRAASTRRRQAAAAPSAVR